METFESTSQVGAVTIAEAMDRYFKVVSMARSAHTAKAYHVALSSFQHTLETHGIKMVDPITDLPEESVAWFAEDLNQLATATESLYLTALSGFFQFISAEEMKEINLARIKILIRQRSRRQGLRLPQFPRMAIEELLEKVDELISLPVENDQDRLINLRDRAFLVTLADTGLRVHEACALKRGEIDYWDKRAIIIGKGNKQAIIRFSDRSIKAIKQYITARAPQDGASGVPLADLPVFARHDKGAGSNRLRPITTTTGRNIVRERVVQLLGKEAEGTITPHSFRHYFVTKILKVTKNLKLAQELARHQNIAVTQRYAHLTSDELDEGFDQAINQI